MQDFMLYYHRKEKQHALHCIFVKSKGGSNMFLYNIEKSWGSNFRLNLLDKLVFPYSIPAREMADCSDMYPQEVNFYRTEDFR